MTLNRPKLPPEDLDKILNEAKNFTETFFKSSTSSIDLFLATNKEYYEIGKKAIILNILEAEKKSRFREHIPEEDNRKQDWYFYLFNEMREGLIDPGSYNSFGENQITFITFNYDRSLEHFLHESLSNTFSSAPKEQIINQLKNIPIYHVYGAIDILPWQGGDIPYRDNYDMDTIDKMKDNIKIIYEKNNSNLHMRPMQLAIDRAERVFFLGFGYAEENLNFLDIPKHLSSNKKVYGTAFGLSDNKIFKKRALLNQNYQIEESIKTTLNNPIIKDMDCLKLLRNYL